jgi:hypothetical protein
MPADFGKLIARKRRQTARLFCRQKRHYFALSIEPLASLTISNISVVSR